MKKSKALIVFHRVDYDGIFSALICKKFLKLLGYKVDLFGYNYGDEIPSIDPETVSTLYMVDVSFPGVYMLELKEKFGDRFIYINHHITAEQESIELGFSDLPGIRKNGTAACELCWEYCFPNTECPIIIQMLGTYDVWNKERYCWDDVLRLQYALKARYGVRAETIEPDLDDLCGRCEIGDLISEGKTIEDYLKKTRKSAVKVYSFEVTVAGRYKGVCILGTEYGSNVFESVFDKYDIYMVCNRKGENRYNLSMYMEPDRLPEFSAGEYLKSINPSAGGHRCAAGIELTLEQFIKLITECRI